MKRILLIAAFLYLFIAPFTYHPDNKGVMFWASSANGTVWNIWEYGEKNLRPDQQYGYPPVHFYLDKLQYTIAKPLAGPGFVEWIATPDKSDLFQPLLPRYMMATKFTLILFALLAGYLIYLLAKQLGQTEKRARIAAAIWFFNPITLYSIPMMGQNDVMAIVFFLGGWLLLTKHPKIAAVIFGLAASIKTYPLIWLMFLLPATKGITRKQKIGVALLSVIVYVMTLVPFLHNPTFLSVGMKPEVNSRFLIPQIAIGFDQAIYIVPVLLSVVFFASEVSPAAILLTANLVLLGFSHFHPQWYTWVVPFFALWVVTQKKTNTILASTVLSIVAIGSWIAVILLFADKWLSLGLFGVANSALGNLPTIREYLQLRGVNVVSINNLAHTALAAVGLISLVALVSRKFVDNSEEWSSDMLEKIDERWHRFPKVIRILMVTIIVGGTSVVWIGIMQLFPAPLSTTPLTKSNYVEINNQVQGSIETKQNNFYRFDLALSNPKQRNVGTFLVSLSDETKILQQQTVSGMNIGEDTILRFDLSTIQEKSKDKIYKVEVLAIEGTKSASTSRNEAGFVSVSINEKNNQNSMAVQQFFKPSKSVNDLIGRTIEKTQVIIGQISWYFGVLFVLLILWV